MAAKKHYIDRDEFHEVMKSCKRKDELSPRAVELFTILSKEASRKYYFEYEEDYEDAASHAIYDLLKYWRGFKENPVVQLEICRNFNHGESFIISVDGMKEIKCVAIDKDYVNPHPIPDEIYFIIGDKPNSSIKNIKQALGITKLGVYLDMVKCKITFMDNYNIDPDYTKYNSFIEFFPNISGETYVYNEKNKHIIDVITTDGVITKVKRKEHNFLPISNSKFFTANKYKFTEPPNSFSYFSSVTSNACLKFIDKRNPKALRNGNHIKLGNQSTDSKFFNI